MIIGSLPGVKRPGHCVDHPSPSSAEVKERVDCSRSFSVVIRFAVFCYGRFMAMRYKFNLVTYVQRPLVIDRRGGTERNLNEIMAGSR